MAEYFSQHGVSSCAVISAVSYTHLRKDNLANEIRKVKAQIERLTSLRSSLYDDYIEQLLTEQEYLYAKIKYEKDEVALKDRLNELLLQQKKYDQTYSCLLYTSRCV